MNKTVIVTGGSSGIGKSTAELFVRAGYTVYTVSRGEHAPVGKAHIRADVSDPDLAAAAVETVVKAEGGVDVLINCAGFGISGAAEFTRPEDSRRQMEVNLFGTDNMIRAVLPHMRAASAGKIINISSVAGCVPIPFQLWYSASKAAINSYTMALANELRPFGISVCAVMPGDTKTGFTDARKKETAGDDCYGGAIERSVSRMEKDERGGAPPESVAKKVLKLAKKKKTAPLYTVGTQYKLIVLLVRLLPPCICNRLIGLLYAS
jgi:NAD(P)-dependent dehydrogenase (short-subunit alcohol dehydrogenase family)